MPRGRKYKQYGRRKIDAGITNFAFSSVRTSLSGVLSTSLGLMEVDGQAGCMPGAGCRMHGQDQAAYFYLGWYKCKITFRNRAFLT